MGLPIQQLALDVQNTTTHLQLASASLNSLAAAPPPALGGTPQWALDMQHEQKWEFYVMKVLLHNSTVSQHEHAEWSLARVLNSSSANDNEPLTPLCTPFPRLPVPVIPPPPGPGAAANPPPAFAPGPIIVPAAHVLFPLNKGALRSLTGANLTTLLGAYNCPGLNLQVAAQRTAFARHIGVTL